MSEELRAEIQRLRGNSDGDRAIIEHLRAELRGARGLREESEEMVRQLRAELENTQSQLHSARDYIRQVSDQRDRALDERDQPRADRATWLREAAERLRAKAGEEWPGIGVLLEDIVSVVLADEAEQQ